MNFFDEVSSRTRQSYLRDLENSMRKNIICAFYVGTYCSGGSNLLMLAMLYAVSVCVMVGDPFTPLSVSQVTVAVTCSCVAAYWLPVLIDVCC